MGVLAACLASCDISRSSPTPIPIPVSQRFRTLNVDGKTILHDFRCLCLGRRPLTTRFVLSSPVVSDLRFWRRVRLPRPERLLHRDAEGIRAVVTPGTRGAPGSHGKQASRRCRYLRRRGRPPEQWRRLARLRRTRLTCVFSRARGWCWCRVCLGEVACVSAGRGVARVACAASKLRRSFLAVYKSSADVIPRRPLRS